MSLVRLRKVSSRGNYIGPELDEEEEQHEQILDQQEPEIEEDNQMQLIPADGKQTSITLLEHTVSNQIILHEDKKYYPSAEEVFGRDVEALVQEEDTQPLSEPIIAPIKKAKTYVLEKGLPVTKFNKEYAFFVGVNSFDRFMADLAAYPELIRNVALVGHIHHGKTALMDVLVTQTHDMHWDLDSETRYTDVHDLERSRGLSIKSMPMSLVMQDLKSKSYLLNLMDTPGASFSRKTDDQVTLILRMK